MTNSSANKNTKPATTINFLEKKTWDTRLAECVNALNDCQEGTVEERLKGLEKVIGTMYPMYGLGVIKNLAGRAMEKFIKNRKVAQITQGVKENFLSVWLDHDDWHAWRIALIGILGLQGDIGIFNDVFFSQKEIWEKEAREVIFLEAYGKIAKNLFYWKDLPDYSKKKEIKEKAMEVIDSHGKGRIAKRSYLILLSIVAEAFDKRSKEYDEAEKIRQSREEKIREEETATFKAEQLIRAAEREEAKKREEAENLRRLAEKKARKEKRQQEVNSALTITLSNGKKAKVLPTVDHVVCLATSQYAVVDGTIYQRTGNGVKKDEFASIKEETQPVASPSVAAVVTKNLPNNLDTPWLSRGGEIYKAHVVPSWVLDDKNAQREIKIRGYEYVAIQEGENFAVYSGTMLLFGKGFKKATDEQKRLAKQRLSTSAKKSSRGMTFKLVPGEDNGEIAEALQAAMA